MTSLCIQSLLINTVLSILFHMEWQKSLLGFTVGIVVSDFTATKAPLFDTGPKEGALESIIVISNVMRRNFYQAQGDDMNTHYAGRFTSHILDIHFHWYFFHRLFKLVQSSV